MGRTSKYTPISLLELLTLSAGRFDSSHTGLKNRARDVHYSHYNQLAESKKEQANIWIHPGMHPAPRDLVHVIYVCYMTHAPSIRRSNRIGGA